MKTSDLIDVPKWVKLENVGNYDVVATKSSFRCIPRINTGMITIGFLLLLGSLFGFFVIESKKEPLAGMLMGIFFLIVGTYMICQELIRFKKRSGDSYSFIKRNGQLIYKKNKEPEKKIDSEDILIRLGFNSLNYDKNGVYNVGDDGAMVDQKIGFVYISGESKCLMAENGGAPNIQKFKDWM